MNKKQKLIFLACAGSIMEYYDFIIYGMMAIYLSAVFFPNTSSEVTYLKSFSILSIGYLARPLGGYFFGVISDLYGRKKTVVLLMLVMSIATFIIGLLPTYEKAGILAPLLLTLARFLQGLSFGAEIPSMTTLIRENSQGGRSGKYFGLIMSSTGLGALLASFMVFLLSRYFDKQEIIEWGWRIPFLVGSLLAIFILIIRNRIDETPEFLEMKNTQAMYHSPKQIRKELIKNNKKEIILGISSTLFFSFLILFNLYLPVYLNQYFGYSTEVIFSVMTLSLFMCVVVSPILGHWFDKTNGLKVIRITVILFMFFLAASFQLLKAGSFVSLIFFLCGLQLFISGYATNLMALLPTLFPTPLRTTGIGVCYNIAYAVGSLTPMILTALVHPHSHEMTIFLFSMGVVVITLLGTSRVRSNKLDKVMAT